MVAASAFDSFDASGLDGFIESPLSARDSGPAGKFLLWANRQDEIDAGRVPLGPIALSLVNDHGLEYDAEDTWSGVIADYSLIVFQPFVAAVAYVSGGTSYQWSDTPLPSWRQTIIDGGWAGRVFMDSIPGELMSPNGTAARAFIEDVAAAFGLAVSSGQGWIGLSGPVEPPAYAGIGPTFTHALTDDVSWIATSIQMASVSGDGAPLTVQYYRTGGVFRSIILMRESTRTFSSGNRTSAVIANGGLVGLQGSPYGTGEPSTMREQALRFAWNLWSVPV